MTDDGEPCGKTPTDGLNGVDRRAEIKVVAVVRLKAVSPVTAAVVSVAAIPTLAQMPTPTAKQFVMKAGASDKFEISEAKLMMNSKNSDIRSFASQMVTDHSKSTNMVKTAAMKDGIAPTPPMLTAMQKSNLAKLEAAKGKARDALYIEQQKPAHQDALALMQGYSASGTATHLKDAAGQITPVVQSHLDMLNKMPMAM